MRGKEEVSLDTYSARALGKLYTSCLYLIAIYNLLRFHLILIELYIGVYINIYIDVYY